MPIAAAGLLELRQVFHVTLGANLGTTCTGLLAAMLLVTSGESGAITGLAIACVHLCFNSVGMIVVLGLPFLRNLPLRAAEQFAELCLKRKSLAVGYLLGVFFGLPALLLFLVRAFEALRS